MGFRNDDDFDAQSYVRVNERLTKFWEKYPEGAIETDAIVQDGSLMVEARLYRTEGSQRPLATGHSFLSSLDGDKVGEYTETVAVGRALANAGFLVEKSIASAEEMTRFKERQESKEESKEEAPRASRFKRKTEPAAQDTPEDDEDASPKEGEESDEQSSAPPPKLRAASRFSRDKLVNRR